MGKTFEHESALPNLPVPSLVSTAEHLLAALKPLIPAEEHQILLDRSIDFVTSGLVRTLQQFLLESSHSSDGSNYLDAEGISASTPGIYGELRGNTLPRNPFFILEDDPLSKTALPPSQASRAAVLVTSALRFICALRLEQISPDVTPKSGKPLSMNSYKNLFGTSRVPIDLEGRQTGVTITSPKSLDDSRHIVVLSHSQFYVLEVLTEFTEQGHMVWFSKHELRVLLETIIEDSERSDVVDATKQSIGCFTTESKGVWKLARRWLKAENEETLDLIDNALFVLCLDHESPETDVEKVQTVSHGTSKLNDDGVQVGTCTSRWYDKLQIVVTKNSVAGVIWESTSMDGTSVLRFISDVYTDSVLRLARKINGLDYTLWPKGETVKINDQIEKPNIRKLAFNLSAEMRTGLHLAETRLTDLINQHNYVTHIIPDFGTDLIVNKMRLSADSLFQICVQLTLYALYGRIPSSSEPISTRKFRNARTETITIQSDHVLRCCQEFITQTSSHQKWNSITDACAEHKRKVSAALNGKGFERHLSALRSAYIQRELLYKLHPDVERHSAEEVPPLIFEPAIDLLYKPELLIANCGNPALHLFGVTPAVPSGFGVGYIIKDDHITVCASSQWRQTDRFLSTLGLVVEEVKTCWRASVPMERTGSRARELEVNSVRNLTLDNPILGSVPEALVSANTSSAEPKPYKAMDTSSDYILGGYDYFDVGDLESRSDLVTRASNSRLVSRSGSRQLSRVGSASNLKDSDDGKINSMWLGRKVVIQDEI
ncbi:unnamed protein product [Kuraishia capsulata CBS 1993]|uniref:Choline/carnitine acyltransferase domain-containing protein n=1 Tax=Kuraishia capsulata CBS 1993 TaxID=1382522 RepID=W6MS69_9ASCO|nr:uncharacterized protein KUCA_T00005526001 [Kuraishia capsulata CBS 1993]CDK29534.1 unnamed protein product [Kuraishia capsulata CBS 1993]